MHQNCDFCDGACSYICNNLVSFNGAIGLVKLPYVFSVGGPQISEQQ
jgi:hypothetical protein